MFLPELRARAETLITQYKRAGVRLTTAESCTGGLLAALLTDIQGASAVFDRGYVTYSNAAKTTCLRVDASAIAAHGAVSAEIARAMAEGAARSAGVEIAVSITGIAGPGGGTPEKPVGLVYIGCYVQGNVMAEECRFSGNRQEIRLAAVDRALTLLLNVLNPAP